MRLFERELSIQILCEIMDEFALSTSTFFALPNRRKPLEAFDLDGQGSAVRSPGNVVDQIGCASGPSP